MDTLDGVGYYEEVIDVDGGVADAMSIVVHGVEDGVIGGGELKLRGMRVRWKREFYLREACFMP
jgi:hypothetical protein